MMQIMIINFFICTIMSWFTITLFVDSYLMSLPKLNHSIAHPPSQYLITTPNRIDFQTSLECSAYSSAYVLRHFGQEANGPTIYAKMPNKMKNGCVYPRGLLNYLNANGLFVRYCKGSINQLKQELTIGVPVIVLIKVTPNQKYIHYVPVVGYDKTYFYLAESLDYLANAQEESNYYNRKITVTEFKKLWALNDLKMPIYNNTYFISGLKQERITL